jgi:Trypsin-like peptidase domain
VGPGTPEAKLHARLAPSDEVHAWSTWADGATCKVVTSRGSGTGFLVASDLILSARHVLESELPDILLRPSVEFAATESTEAILVGSMPGSEWVYAEDYDLDYAIFRIQEPIGLKRGWLSLNKAPQNANINVYVPQHPGGVSQLHLAKGTVVEHDKKAPHILFHTASTEKGSSGGPCIDDEGTVIGLHRAGDKFKNNAIASWAIVEHLHTQGRPLPEIVRQPYAGGLCVAFESSTDRLPLRFDAPGQYAQMTRKDNRGEVKVSLVHPARSYAMHLFEALGGVLDALDGLDPELGRFGVAISPPGALNREQQASAIARRMVEQIPIKGRQQWAWVALPRDWMPDWTDWTDRRRYPTLAIEIDGTCQDEDVWRARFDDEWDVILISSRSNLRTIATVGVDLHAHADSLDLVAVIEDLAVNHPLLQQSVLMDALARREYRSGASTRLVLRLNGSALRIDAYPSVRDSANNELRGDTQGKDLAIKTEESGFYGQPHRPDLRWVFRNDTLTLTAQIPSGLGAMPPELADKTKSRIVVTCR